MNENRICKEAREIAVEADTISTTILELTDDTIGVELIIRRKANKIRKAATRIRELSLYDQAAREAF